MAASSFGSWLADVGSDFVSLAGSLTQAGISKLSGETTAELNNTGSVISATNAANGQERSAWSILVNGLAMLAKGWEDSTIGREVTLDTALTSAENSYATTATSKWATYQTALAQADKTYLVQLASGGNPVHLQPIKVAARSTALKTYQFELLDAGVTLNGSLTTAVQTYVTGQSAADASEAQGEAAKQKDKAVADTTAEVGLTSALVAAGNLLAVAGSAAAGAFSSALSAAQTAWNVATSEANGDHAEDNAARSFGDKMSEWWEEISESDPVSTAAGIITTLVTTVAAAETSAAVAMGNSLVSAVTAIGGADVSLVTSATNAE